ncbi:hypothetical protein ACM66B_007027 [Microbotryomycetes sp. NB124-2]
MSGSSLHLLDTPVEAVQIAYDYVNAAEEMYLISKVDAVGDGSVKSAAWQPLNGRRSMYWGGTLTKNGSLVPKPFESFMTTAWPNVLQRIDALQVFSRIDPNGQDKGKGPNHCLVNEYLPGQGIMPHSDGPAYAPVVATLSISSHAILKLTPRASSDDSTTSGDDSSSAKAFTVFLPPRSLVVLSSNVYSDYLHSIEPVKLDTMDDLMACVNWDDWWQVAAGGLWSELDQANSGAAAVAADGDQTSSGTANEKFESKQELVKEVVARRRMVESAQGWERGRRISLTCRRVDKVVTGLKFGR